MRYAKDRKEQTRRNIVRSAAKLFAAKGFKATSIDAIMRDCKLTRGGFYAHFRSKSQLYRHAMTLATQSAARRRVKADAPQHASTYEWLDGLLAEYLHTDDRAFFATDVASTDPDVREAYANACNALIARIAANGAYAENAVQSVAAMLIGAVAMVRTVDDAVLKAKLIASVKHSVEALLGPSPSFFWEPPSRADRPRARN